MQEDITQPMQEDITQPMQEDITQPMQKMLSGGRFWLTTHYHDLALSAAFPCAWWSWRIKCSFDLLRLGVSGGDDRFGPGWLATHSLACPDWVFLMPNWLRRRWTDQCDQAWSLQSRPADYSQLIGRSHPHLVHTQLTDTEAPTAAS